MTGIFQNENSNLSLEWGIVWRLVINWIWRGIARGGWVTSLIASCRGVGWLGRRVGIGWVLEVFLCELLLWVLLLEVLLGIAARESLYWVRWLSRIMSCCSRSGRCRLTCSIRCVSSPIAMLGQETTTAAETRHHHYDNNNDYGCHKHTNNNPNGIYSRSIICIVAAVA